MHAADPRWWSGLVTAAMLLCGSVRAAEPALIPWPASVEAGSGSFVVDGRTAVCAPGAARGIAERMQEVVRATHALDLTVRGCGRAGISLLLAPGDAPPGDESYSLDVDASGLKVRARTQAGLFLGAMTAAQLLSVGEAGAPVTLAGVRITDRPRFRWRGLMLDAARHFVSVDDVKRMLDQMAQHKLNVLHFHLTDDQGWRIEIKRYPELTTIGAWRTPPSNGGPGSETRPYGGFYTQAEIRDIVAYAGARYITVVPEIDLPGHAQAVVAAHPQVGVPGDRPPVSSDWGVNTWLYNTNDDSLQFVKNVLDEVMGLFPGRYVHVGGDEAVKDQWRASPAIQKQIRDLGLTDEEGLQSWFMGQIGQYLAAHDRVMVGWDEILEGGVPANATVMSWRGTQGAITAARLGHDVVLSPAPTLYFDNLQSARDDEPAGRLGIVPLSQVYNFEVMPTVLTLEEGRHVLGAQGNLWSEYMLSGWHLQHAAFPRLDALAEAVWTQPASMNWAGFLRRLPAQLRRYRQQGIPAADSAFAVDFQVADGVVALVNQTSFGTIRYTLDGSEPNRQSARYDAPLSPAAGVTIRATAFSDEGLPLAAARAYRVDAAAALKRSSAQLRSCEGDNLRLRLPLTPNAPDVAPAYNVDLFKSCFVFPRAPLANVTAVEVNIARLSRNFGLANHKDQVRSYRATTAFGELVAWRDRCESGMELGRAALPDPARSDNRQTLSIPVAAGSGDHDLCLIFTAPVAGPLYAIDDVNLRRSN